MTNTIALDPRRAAVRAGFSRGWIETRQNLTETIYVFGHAIGPVAYVAVLLFFRGKEVPGTDFALGLMVLPSLLGMTIVYGGLSAPAPNITADREDGTLLRAKATPNGMLGYLIGKIVMFASTTLLGLFAIVIPGIMIVDNLILDARAWLLLALLFIVGMVSTVPIGVALGSLMKSSMQSALVPLAFTLIMIISGIFYPITVLPTWLQSVAQAFPVYWVGLGARAAMLPPAMVAAEIGQSWRTVEMFAVLGLWAVIGVVLAPILLRRMARRQSGSALAKLPERYMPMDTDGWRARTTSSTTASRCCAPNVACHGPTWPTRSVCTTRPSATSNARSSALRCTWRFASRPTSTSLSRSCSP